MRPTDQLSSHLFYHIRTIKLNAYADDEQLYDSDIDPVALDKRIQNDLSIANQWYKDNGMIANASQRPAMILGRTDHLSS